MLIATRVGEKSLRPTSVEQKLAHLLGVYAHISAESASDAIIPPPAKNT